MYDSVFSRAVDKVLEHEGGYVDDPDDPGGCTHYGITLKTLRQHRGDESLGCDAVRALTTEQAMDIYWQRYWHGNHYDDMPEQVVLRHFDMAVNAGKRAATLILQRALCACGAKVDPDGVLGPQTVAAVTSVTHTVSLVCAMRSERAGYYRLLAQRRPQLEKFLKGWLRRAYS